MEKICRIPQRAEALSRTGMPLHPQWRRKQPSESLWAPTLLLPSVSSPRLAFRGRLPLNAEAPFRSLNQQPLHEFPCPLGPANGLRYTLWRRVPDAERSKPLLEGAICSFGFGKRRKVQSSRFLHTAPCVLKPLRLSGAHPPSPQLAAFCI